MPTALHDLWHHIQRQLFPVLIDELGELGEKDHQFVEVIALLPLGSIVPRYEWQGVGCPPHERIWLLHAFIAKEVYQFATREALVDALRARPTLRRLCGWEHAYQIPSLSTFCRAFAQFAADQLPQQIHAKLIEKHCGSKLVGHVSRDSTAIEAPDRHQLLQRVRLSRQYDTSADVPRWANNDRLLSPPSCSNRRIARWRTTWLICRQPQTTAPRRVPKGTWNIGTVTNYTWT
jgi:hypothetical protein